MIAADGDLQVRRYGCSWLLRGRVRTAQVAGVAVDSAPLLRQGAPRRIAVICGLHMDTGRRETLRSVSNATGGLFIQLYNAVLGWPGGFDDSYGTVRAEILSTGRHGEAAAQ